MNKELENLRKIKADHDALSERNSKRYFEWKKATGEQLTEALKKDGFNKWELRAELSWYGERLRPVEVMVKTGNNRLYFTIQNCKISKLSASSLSMTIRNETDEKNDLNEFAEYYQMVGDVTRLLQRGLPVTYAAIENIRDNDREEWTGPDIEKVNIKIAKLEEEEFVGTLHVGMMVEILIPRKNRWDRGGWKQGEIKSITAANVIIEQGGWNYRVKKCDLGDRIRFS
jgi:hypothetical protein